MAPSPRVLDIRFGFAWACLFFAARNRSISATALQQVLCMRCVLNTSCVATCLLIVGVRLSRRPTNAVGRKAVMIE